MDISELMKYKPTTAPKRPGGREAESRDGARRADDMDDLDDDPNEPYEKRAAKRRRRQQALAAAAAAVKRRDVDKERDSQHLQDEGDEGDVGDDETTPPVLDEAEMKRLILNFEKKALKNQELRIKFPDEPTKFMASEVDLHDAIQELRGLATAPDLYPSLVGLGCVPSFLGLLSHENSDISVAIVDLIQELTDVDTLHESETGAETLIEGLVSNQVTSLLVQNLDRLNDAVREESDGIHNTLSIFENLIEFRPEICKEPGLLSWLVRRLKVKVPFDTNKLYASEILSIFLQNDADNRVKFGEMGAIDSLLQQLAYYKRHNPNTPEEQEMMENLFDCLCSLLLHTPNRDLFLRGEGLQLMNLMLREKKVSRSGALKVLNHALIGKEGKDNCMKFVDILGLRTIFPLFMKTPKKHKRKGVTAEEHEEHVISIIASLMKNTRGSQRQRLLGKFTEGDHEKVERVMELHFKYLDRVSETDEKVKDLDEDEAYLERLDGGLFTLQLVDYIIAEACASGAPSVKQRVMQILNQRGSSVTTIRNVLREYAGNIGDNQEKSDDKEAEKQHILQLVDKF